MLPICANRRRRNPIPRRHPMANSKFAQSDAYLSELMREVRALPEADASLSMGRRTFFKLAGAGTAGLVLGFHLPALAATADDKTNLAMNAFVKVAPDNTVTIY